MSRFSINLTDSVDSRPLVPASVYPMRIAKGEVKTGTVKDSDRKWMSVNLTFIVRDDEVSKLLNQDEPKIYSSFYVNVDEEGMYQPGNNPELGSLLIMFDLNTTEASEKFAEGIDEDNAFDFTAKYVSNMVEAFIGYDILGKVGHRPKAKGSDEMVANVIKFAKLED